jgi:tRNA/rRNA methyltransferase
MIIILNRPQMGENVGFAARSMMNFGITELRLVAPGLMEENEWGAKEHNRNFDLNLFLEKSESVAKGGAEIIKNAKIFESIEDALLDVSTCFALSARRREVAKEVIMPSTCISEILKAEETLQGEKNALLFGAEASGLSNKDIILCKKIVEIEANPLYSSINLGMSVGIMCHLYNSTKNATTFKNNERKIRNKASLSEISQLTKILEEKLEAAAYFKVPEKQEGMMVNIKNIFTRAELTATETRTLIGIFNLIKSS